MILLEEKWREISYTTLVIVLPCGLLKSWSRTSRIEWVQRDTDLMREGSIKQWKELDLIRAIAERDAESWISDGTKEIGKWKESGLERVGILSWHSFGNTPSSMQSSACVKFWRLLSIFLSSQCNLNL